jgi:thiol-disulfide isomerase/thioredoxin
LRTASRCGPVLAASILVACAGEAPPEAEPAPPVRAAARPAQGPTPVAPASSEDAPLAVVTMTLQAGLLRLVSDAPPLRGPLTGAPPADVDASGLPADSWSWGAAPVTRTESLPFALSADRSALYCDADRDGVLGPADRAPRATDLPGTWFRVLARLRQDLDGVTHEEQVPLVIGLPPAPASWAFSRLDAWRGGDLSIDGRRVALAVVDRTYRGWFSHLQRDRLYVDVDADGLLDTADDSHEVYRLGEPFPVGDRDVVVTGVGPFGRTLSVTASPARARRSASLREGRPAPDFEATTLEGDRIRLSAFRDRWVLLDFWATWCGPCVRELPHLVELHQEHPELAIIGISGDRTREALEGFLQRRSLPWPQVYVDARAVQTLYRVRTYPSTFLIAPDGTIAARGLRGGALAKRLAASAVATQAGAGGE